MKNVRLDVYYTNKCHAKSHAHREGKASKIGFYKRLQVVMAAYVGIVVFWLLISYSLVDVTQWYPPPGVYNFKSLKAKIT
jgi:hypothetical protein